MNILNVHHLISSYGYMGIFLVVFIESGVFFFLPGDSLLFTAGLLAVTGDLKLMLVLALASVAAFLGNLVGYWIGQHVESLKGHAIFRKLIHDSHIDKAKDFFERRGRSAVLLGRFVPGVRTFVPWVAGVAGMPKKTFVEWSALGALVWVGVMTLAGYFLGRVFPNLEHYLSYIVIGIVVVSIIPVVIEWLKGRRETTGE